MVNEFLNRAMDYKTPDREIGRLTRDMTKDDDGLITEPDGGV